MASTMLSLTSIAGFYGREDNGPCSDKLSYMNTMKLLVPDISCDHCKTSIESATQALDGVDFSEVDISSKTVTLSFEPADVGLEAIVNAIEEQGYEVAG